MLTLKRKKFMDLSLYNTHLDQDDVLVVKEKKRVIWKIFYFCYERQFWMIPFWNSPTHTSDIQHLSKKKRKKIFWRRMLLNIIKLIPLLKLNFFEQKIAIIHSCLPFFLIYFRFSWGVQVLLKSFIHTQLSYTFTFCY